MMEVGFESIVVIDAILPCGHVREISGPVGPGWFPEWRKRPARPFSGSPPAKPIPSVATVPSDKSIGKRLGRIGSSRLISLRRLQTQNVFPQTDDTIRGKSLDLGSRHLGPSRGRTLSLSIPTHVCHEVAKAGHNFKLLFQHFDSFPVGVESDLEALQNALRFVPLS